ncbi:phosphate ABC transporter permease subunit PstC [Methylotenera versatilis]|jgi:phosphate transport system permease protein|uniref:Phosphate transport system permease protein n=1 Tax=Methylotenera versatilis (strain 301) TaxID=666681 RepID=D7DJZ8_METV0|nr:phosphate ABC transporter permease subunit PstC [Methylotenera versatilis]ADI30359.1 phosphate ABC transporter, inner membrane subunit PstC [Methylotenera versatilis 301]
MDIYAPSAVLNEQNIIRESISMPNSPQNKNIGATLDKLFRYTTMFFAFLVFILLFGIIITLLVGSLPALKMFGASFYTSTAWNPVTIDFGGVVPIYGTFITALIAMLIGIPVSFGIAIFITELSPNWLKRPIGVAIELLAGIPSIIYGMWGLFVFAPLFADHVQPWMNDNLGALPLIGVLFQGPPMGIGMLTAGFILAIMVIPYTASVMRDVFEIVPSMLKESAYGLGSTTWEVIWNVVLPYTKTGVVGGIMLGLGRALGETMAVTFVIGNAHELSASLMMPGNTISSALANEFTEAVGDVYTSSLITLGLTLFVITFIVLSLAKLLLIRLSLREGKQS